MDSNNQFVFIALGAAILFIGFLLPRMRRRSQASRPPDGLFEARAQSARQDLDQLVVEIQELAREHIAKLDTKIRMVSRLLSDCDQRKLELEALLKGAAIAPPPASRPPNPLHEKVYGLLDEGKDTADICAATGLEKGEVDLILGLRQLPRIKT